MTAKTIAQRVRESEARKRERGLVAVKVWIPDTPEDRQAVRDFAAALRKAAVGLPTLWAPAS